MVLVHGTYSQCPLSVIVLSYIPYKPDRIDSKWIFLLLGASKSKLNNQRGFHTEIVSFYFMSPHSLSERHFSV